MSFRRCVWASKLLHNDMLRRIVRVPVLFFDSNPIGRVLNRFAKDTGAIDDQLPLCLYDFFQCLMTVLSAVIVVCFGFPWICLSLIPMVWYFLYLRGYYLKTSREVKRLDGISRSPILSLLTETFDGLATIRAFGRHNHFERTCKDRINENVRAYSTFIAVSRWLGFRLDAIVSAMVAVATFGAVLAKEHAGNGTPAVLAVGLLYVNQLSGLFQWCVRQSAEVENYMVSVERVLAYTKLDQEPALMVEGEKSPLNKRPDWPERGEVVARGLQVIP